MKKKDLHDEQEVSDLLKQLQKSFAEPEKAEKPKKKKAEDVDDQKFQEKLAAMLGKLTQPSPKKTKARKQTRPTEENATVEDTVVEDAIVEEAIVEDTVVEEATVEDVIVPKKKPAKKRAPKRKSTEPLPPEDAYAQTPEPPLEATLPEDVTVVVPEESHAEMQEEIQEDAAAIPQEDAPAPPEEAFLEDVSAEADTTPVQKSTKHPLDTVIPLPYTDSESEGSDPIGEREAVTESPAPIIEQPKEAATPVARAKQLPTAPASVPRQAPAPKRADKPQARPTPQTITIAPPAQRVDVTPAKAEPTKKETTAQPNRPVVIKPKSEPVAAVPHKNDADTIVIRPRGGTVQAQEAIVIQPPTAKKDAPTPRLQAQSETPAAPIKIGKESKPRVAPEIPRDPPNKPKPIMNQKPNTTIVPSTAFAKKTDDQEIDKTGQKTEAPVRTATPTAPKSKSVKAAPPKNQNTVKKATSDTPAPQPASNGKTTDPASKKSGRASKKKALKELTQEPQLSAMDLVRQRCGLSEDDVAMIFELGYENELGRLVGYDNLRQLKNEHLRRTGFTEHGHYRTAFGYRGEEYASTSQRDAVTAAYLHDRKSLIARVLLTALCTLALLFLEVSRPSSTFAYLPLVMRLVALLVLSGSVALSYRQIAAGLHSFFQFTPTPYSVPALLAPTSILYELITLLIERELFRVGCLTSLVLLLVALCDLLRFSTEMRALRIVSSDEPKIALATAQPRKKKLRVGDKTVKIINDDIDQNRYAVRTTMHTVGHFRRFNNMRSATRPFAVFTVMAFALSTVAAFVCAIATSNAGYAVSDFMTVLLLTTPLSAVFSYFYPLYLGNRLLATRGCALIGDEAVTEYEGKKTVIFRDTDLYAAQRATEIAVRSGDALKRDMAFASALFSKLGGTLGQMAQVFPTSTEGELSVTVTRVHENGIEAVVDNRYQLLLGNAAFLTHSGVKVPKETTDVILKRASNVGLVYLAIDNSLRLSYEVEYQAQKPFEHMVRHLAEAGCVVAIHSYDPNIDEVFLQKSRPNASARSVTVLTPGRFEEDKPAEFTDTGAVAQRSPLDIAYPLYAADAIAKNRQFAFRMQIISSLLGALLVMLITLFGNGVMLNLFAVMGIQLFWIALVCLAAHSELNADKLHFHKKTQK